MRKNLLKSTFVFSVMTFISRILGFVRDMVVAHIFGATGTTDAFFVAFKIPNFMRRLFAEGAFSQAFVPILAEYKQQRAREELQQFVNHSAGTLGGILLIVTMIGVIAAPIFIMVFAPGFSNAGDQFELASTMLRITFPYVLFISLTAYAGGVLNTHNYFAGPAFTPVFLNVALIVAAIWGAPHFQHPIQALAWGVFAGGLIQLLFQYPFLRHINLVPKFKWFWRDPGVQRVLKLMLPALFGVSVIQIGLLIDTIFASFLAHGSITWLYNSERLMMFPLGVFGVAISTVVLPNLAKKFASDSEQEYAITMNWAIQSVLLIGIPAAIGLIMLSGPLLTTLFNYGKFNQFDVVMAQRSLIAYAIGVPFMMLIKTLASSFYARQDIKTPVKIAVVALFVNIMFNFLLIAPLRHAGLALASSLAAITDAGILFIFLLRRKYFKLNKTWWLFLIRIIIANIMLFVLIYALNSPQQQWFIWDWQQRLLHVLAIVFASVLVYLIALRGTGFKLIQKS